MKLLYICTYMFLEDQGNIYTLPSSKDNFFEKYMDVFDEVRVLGEPVKAYLSKKSLVKMYNPNISVRIEVSNTSPLAFMNDKELEKTLVEEILKADALLIKPQGRRGMMAIKIAKKYNKPYMIEMTGDIHNALKQHPNFLKRMYAPILYSEIKKSIYDCEYGLYVSKNYLQSVFPIKGKMCGCADVVIEKNDESVIYNRINKIENRKTNDVIKLGLIGFYQGKMKGVDTAIRALSRLSPEYHLYVLGNGTEENRTKWFDYGKKMGVSVDRIHFPTPLPSSKDVLIWLDGIDAFVLPTRSEGLCRCVVEAMSRGCPCFTSNICTMPELIQEGCLHQLGDDRELAEQIKLVMNDKEKEKEIANINYEKSKEYEFEKLRKKRNEFLKEFRAYCENYNA